MKIAVYFLLIIGSVLLSCSNSSQTEEENDKHEQLFNSTADSLRKYNEAGIFEDYTQTDEIFNDNVSLDYKTFKKKYEANSLQMDQIARTFSSSIDIAKTSMAIEKNTQESNKIMSESSEISALLDSINSIDVSYKGPDY